MSITLDHIVILVSPHFLSNLPPWLTSAFTVISGGRHSNGITENKLILFQDGVYIELIAFVEGMSPDVRASTRWGRRKEGEIVDLALTLLPHQGNEAFDPEDSFRKEIKNRVRDVGTGLEYSDPIAGGRVTPDGVELKWAVAVPRSPDRSIEGKLPFWCLDRTPRDLRVPFRAANGATEHGCGALGVRAVDVFVEEDEKELQQLIAVYESFLGKADVSKGVTAWSQAVVSSWELGVPATVSQASREDPPVKILTLRGPVKGDKGLDNPAQRHRGRSSGPQVSLRITLALFTSGPSKVLSGEIAPGRILDIELIHVS